MQIPETDNIHDELASVLGERTDAYRVERVLKSAPGELTQLVWLRTAAGGELGPYVRKIIDESSGTGGVYEQLYERERGGARFRQLPRIVSCERSDGKLVVVMERVVGPTLREVIERAGAGERLGLATRLAPAVCEAAAELHGAFDQPVIHRDLTPSNIICTDGDQLLPCLIDLGIARSWREGAQTDTVHLGTRAYAPPEQYGFGQTDVRSDVYALGLLAFFCLTGRDPSQEDRERGFASPGVPEAWRAVIAKACALDPSERYASAAELAEALRTAVSGRPVRTHTSLGLRGRLDAARRAVAPVWSVLVVVMVALIVAVSVYIGVTPGQWTQPTAIQNYYDYLVAVPVYMLTAGYILVDRRWLRERIPWFSRVPARRVWHVLLGACFASFLLLIVIVAIEV